MLPGGGHASFMSWLSIEWLLRGENDPSGLTLRVFNERVHFSRPHGLCERLVVAFALIRIGD